MILIYAYPSWWQVLDGAGLNILGHLNSPPQHQPVACVEHDQRERSGNRVQGQGPSWWAAVNGLLVLRGTEGEVTGIAPPRQQPLEEDWTDQCHGASLQGIAPARRQLSLWQDEPIHYTSSSGKATTRFRRLLGGGVRVEERGYV